MSSPGSGSDYFRKIPYKQDMPPPGGYKKIPFARNIPVRIPLPGFSFGAAILGLTGLGWVGVWYGMKKVRALKEERAIARLSMLPLLIAEQDRITLRQMHAKLEEEKLIMADVPGWEVGASPYSSNVWMTPAEEGPEKLSFLQRILRS